MGSLKSEKNNLWSNLNMEDGHPFSMLPFEWTLDTMDTGQGFPSVGIGNSQRIVAETKVEPQSIKDSLEFFAHKGVLALYLRLQNLMQKYVQGQEAACS